MRDPGAPAADPSATPAFAFAVPNLRFRLVVTEGDERGRTLPLVRGVRTFVGSSELCDVRLRDRMVSRKHLALVAEVDHVVLVDLDSRNGTRIGELEIVSARLRGGETVRVGDSAFVVEASDERAPDEPVSPDDRFGPVLGVSPAMRRLYPRMARAAASDASVLIEGETGTGKEVVAEALHEAGPRARGPFVVLDCTTVAPSLLEATLFGHERGAFTGAVGAQPGVFERAEGGTLFVDEIGDLELPLQARLLRALEKKEIQRVGGARWIRCDVRIVAATRRDLEREVEEGRFRDDLFYRLAIVRLALPPLRERAGDVAFLSARFWEQMNGPPGGPPPALLARLAAHAFPGNVRELRNVIARVLAMGEAEASQALRDPPPALPEPRADADPLAAILAEATDFTRAREQAMALFDRRFVEHALEAHGGNVSRAAVAYGISRRYFHMIRARGGAG